MECEPETRSPSRHKVTEKRRTDDLLPRLKRMNERTFSIGETKTLRSQPASRERQARSTLAVLLTCVALSGCQAMTNPVFDGVPARRLPPEYLGRSREALENIPLSFLRRSPPTIYRVDAG